ncbi:MAG TPA: 1-deoxy-D-xylulose-5-phosphate reductoisomerase, partial [Candidatus Omnitrophota bacterium]|nr:1-deoxy-D-xylulose-5-phosphate reductoisomerase [Candidatus Omnitrophota bacterium]
LRIDPLKIGSLEFERPDIKRFPCLRLAFEALDQGKSAPCVLNASNEVAVDAFIRGAISFSRIPSVIEGVMNRSRLKPITDIESVFEADWQARQDAIKLVERYS